MNKIKASQMFIVKGNKKHRWVSKNNRLYFRLAMTVYYLIKNKEGR